MASVTLQELVGFYRDQPAGTTSAPPTYPTVMSRARFESAYGTDEERFLDAKVSISTAVFESNQLDQGDPHPVEFHERSRLAFLLGKDVVVTIGDFSTLKELTEWLVDAQLDLGFQNADASKESNSSGWERVAYGWSALHRLIVAAAERGDRLALHRGPAAAVPSAGIVLSELTR